LIVFYKRFTHTPLVTDEEGSEPRFKMAEKMEMMVNKRPSFAQIAIVASTTFLPSGRLLMDAFNDDALVEYSMQ
jgi:hypothetical protein